MQTVKTIPGKTYAVESAGEVIITNTETGAIAAQGDGSGQVLFTACANSYEVSDDTAKVVALFKLAPRLKLALLQGGAGGWLPKGFTELDYLESSGTQYIETGIVPQADTRLYIESEIVSVRAGVNSLFGCRNEVGTTQYLYDAYFNVKTETPLSGGLRPIKNFNIEYPEKQRFSAAFTGSEVLFNEATVGKYTPATVTYETSKQLLLFAMNYKNNVSQQSIAKIYSFVLASPERTLLNLVPVLDETGEPCMWDTVSRQKLPNAGQGRFGYRIKATEKVVEPNATTYSLRAPRDPYYVAPSGVYARQAGENELEVLADTEETIGEGWEWFANTAEAHEHFGIVPEEIEELLTE